MKPIMPYLPGTEILTRGLGLPMPPGWRGLWIQDILENRNYEHFRILENHDFSFTDTENYSEIGLSFQEQKGASLYLLRNIELFEVRFKKVD